MLVKLNSINLAIRFFLEMAALLALGVWGWSLGEGIPSFLFAMATPMFAAAIWGIFTVPNDSSRSGNAPIPVPGAVRLIIELAFFASAAGALFATHYSTLAWVFGVIVIVHYALSYKRLYWLLRQ